MSRILLSVRSMYCRNYFLNTSIVEFAFGDIVVFLLLFVVVVGMVLFFLCRAGQYEGR